MPVDASIYGQIQQPQAPNQLNSLAQAMQIQQLQRQGERADMATDQQNKLLQLVGGKDFQSMDTAAKAGALQGVGAFDKAGELVRSDAAASKDKREAEKFQLEGYLKKYELAGQIMNGVSDQATWDRARQQTAQVFGPEAASRMPPQYDPALIEQKRAQAMSVKDNLEQRYKTLTLDETQQHNRTTEALTASGQAVQKRGQDMTDARARETTQNGRIPSGYRPAADGTLEYIPGGPADPNTPKGKGNLTEGQSKSLVYAARMQEANSTFDNLAEGGKTTAIPGSTTPYIGPAITALSGADNQKLVQAKRDFMTAVLRRESGAVISDSEFANGDQQYFPQVGDTPEVIAQKKRNREIATRGIAADVPESEKRISEVRGPKADAPAAAAGVMKVTNAADYAKVPSGSTYTTPDGKTRRKP